MKKKSKIILSSAAVGLLICAGLGLCLVKEMMSRPLYEFGKVSQSDSLLAPPTQRGGPLFWNVEEDTEIYHFQEGIGRNVLIVHGGPGYPYREAWPGLAHLAATHQFVYYDQRGCGRSTRPVDRFSSRNFRTNMLDLDKRLGLGAQIGDIERIRRLLGERQLTIIGHSFGGFLASLYAAEFPDRVKSMVLVAPAETLVMPPPSGGLFEEVRRRLPADMRARFDSWLKRYLDYGTLFSKSDAELTALNDEFALYFSRVNSEPVPEPGKGGGWMVHALYMSMGLKHDYRPLLGNVSAPVLVIHGASDLQPEAASLMYAHAFPNGRFKVIAGAGHFPFYSQQAAFGEAVKQFFGETGS
ncbi:MAG TPA: alpha/beta hydrolase [Syntrophorhabdales bacterium]|nr:alpha/beta hydrolase [Syntrophorhabdales bacterium]